MRIVEGSEPSVVEIAAVVRAERMLVLAEFIGISPDDLEAARRLLAPHEAMFDAAVGSSRRNEIAQLMALDVAELATAYKMMARAVARGGEA
jgi:hypothetical protein